MAWLPKSSLPLVFHLFHSWSQDILSPPPFLLRNSFTLLWLVAGGFIVRCLHLVTCLSVLCFVCSVITSHVVWLSLGSDVWSVCGLYMEGLCLNYHSLYLPLSLHLKYITRHQASSSLHKEISYSRTTGIPNRLRRLFLNLDWCILVNIEPNLDTG